MPDKLKRSSLCDIVLFSLLFIGFSLALGSFTVDDAFISFRYSYNLIHYGIWNYNPDHNYVEAYTSFIYTALAIIPNLLGISIVLFFKLLGLALFLRFLWKASSLCSDRSARALVLAFILLNPNVYIHFYSCLETPLFLVLCLEIYSILLFRAHTRWFYWLLLLLPLTRPEGALLSAFALGLYIWRLRTVPYRFDLGAVMAIGVAYFCWRYWYFGYLLPNTFYAKLSPKPADSMFVNFQTILPYLILFPVLAKAAKDRLYVYIVASALVVYLTIYLPSNLLMNYADRFAAQLFLPVIICGAYYSKCITPHYRIAIALLLAIVLIYTVSYTEIREDTISQVEKYNSIDRIAKELAPFKDHSLTMMVADAGAIPYYSGWKTYDMVGLADKTIAHGGNSLAYMQTIHPDMIFLFGVGKDTVWSGYQAHTIYDYMETMNQYRLIGSIHLPGENGVYYLVFLKENVPGFNAIKKAVTEVSDASERIHSNSWMEKKWFDFQYFMEEM